MIGKMLIGSMLFGGVVSGCATAPRTVQQRQDLEARADATLQTMIGRDPGLRDVLDASYGYAVFPEIGKGGFIVGAAYGRGILYEHGQAVGTVELNQGSLGAQLGGQTLSELLVLRDQYDVALASKAGNQRRRRMSRPSH